MPVAWASVPERLPERRNRHRDHRTNGRRVTRLAGLRAFYPVAPNG